MSEFDVEEFVNKKLDQFIDSFLRTARASLLKFIDGWLRNLKYNFGVELVVETVVEPSLGEIVLHLRAYLPPSEVERARKVIREGVERGLIDSRTRIKILKDLVFSRLGAATGEINALLQAVYKRSAESDSEAGGDREEGHHEERGSGAQSDSQAT